MRALRCQISQLTRVALLLLLASAACAQVSYDRLLKATSEPANWLTYSGDYAAHRFSPLKQIDTGNVKKLSPAWVLQTGQPGKFEATPLVADGVMYFTAEDNLAFAVDARTGRVIWRYQRTLPPNVIPCCGRVNRGFALLGDRLFLGTLDAHVVALDRRSGDVLWDAEAADYKLGYSFTVAPLAVKDKVILGIAGGEYGVRGFIDAYDAATGKRVWRFYTVPAAGEKGSETWAGDSLTRGGVPGWVTGAYDPDLNLVYWPTGNPSPSNNGHSRAGDNLYSNCMLALDADTGTLRWHFQFTPHDTHDWDATETPVLLDAAWEGKPRKLLLQADRNGFFYVLDRTSGAFLLAKPYIQQTWASGITPQGRPIVRPESEPSAEGARVCPGAVGATNFMAPSYSPQTGLLYVTAREQCDIFTTADQTFHPGRVFIGSSYVMETKEKDWGALRGIDPATGEVKVEFRHYSAPWTGVLTTAGGLAFTGDAEGNFLAVDAATGKDLWHFQTGFGIYASPMSYALNGRQYVVIPSGSALFSFALPAE